jgi:hypothetical protein
MASAAKQLVPDPTVNPDEDHLGEGELQRLMLELLRPMLARFLAERGVVAQVGANQFLYWVQFEPTRCIAPDLYVLPGIDQSRVEKSWKLWNEAVVPSFCLEIVSSDHEKDYVTIPTACAEMGVDEVIVFDPEASLSRDRITWQLFRRTKRGGRLEQVERTDRDTVRAERLGCWLTAVGRGKEQRIRVSLDARGEDLYPTEAESERAARDALAEATRARDALELEVKRLRAELATRTRPKRPTRR